MTTQPATPTEQADSSGSNACSLAAPVPNPFYSERMYSSQSGLRLDLEVNMPGGSIDPIDFDFIKDMLDVAVRRMSRRVGTPSEPAKPSTWTSALEPTMIADR